MTDETDDRDADRGMKPLAQVASDWKSRLEAAGRGLVAELRGGVEPTFKCPKCRDTVLVVSPRRKETAGASDETLWFCRCAGGVQAEAGYWFAKIYPTSAGGRRHLDPRGMDEFERYQADGHYGHAMRVQASVEELRNRYEKERSRKLLSLTGESE